jgi:1-acyl-sn-glycerol-3-phosphate acyltransferase
MVLLSPDVAGNLSMRFLVDLAWKLINWVQLPAFWIWSIFWISIALVVRLVTLSPEPALAMARRIWAPGILAMALVRLDVEGLETVDWQRPYLIAANHRSFLDIPILFRGLPQNLRFLVKSELRHLPFLGWYIKAMGMVFVDRRDRSRGLEGVRQASEIARAGQTLVVFPEGTRSKDGRLQKLKTGGLLAAIQSGLPVLPVAITGDEKVLPTGPYRARAGRARLRIGRPIETTAFGPEDRHILADAVRTQLEELLGQTPA